MRDILTTSIRQLASFLEKHGQDESFMSSKSEKWSSLLLTLETFKSEMFLNELYGQNRTENETLCFIPSFRDLLS